MLAMVHPVFGLQRVARIDPKGRCFGAHALCDVFRDARDVRQDDGLVHRFLFGRLKVVVERDRSRRCHQRHGSGGFTARPAIGRTDGQLKCAGLDARHVRSGSARRRGRRSGLGPIHGRLLRTCRGSLVRSSLLVSPVFAWADSSGRTGKAHCIYCLKGEMAGTRSKSPWRLPAPLDHALSSSRLVAFRCRP